MKTISLTKGKVTIVDDEDFEYLNQWKWYYSNGYAMRKPYIKKSKPYRSCVIQLHRLVNKTPQGLQTDHINHDTLDNRKDNLRTVTLQENHFNMSPKKDNRSNTLGVNWYEKLNKWRVRIMIDGKDKSLGYYKDMDEAIAKRKEAEKLYFTI